MPTLRDSPESVIAHLTAKGLDFTVGPACAPTTLPESAVPPIKRERVKAQLPCQSVTVPRRMTINVTASVKATSEANIGGTLSGRLARKGAVKAAVRAILPRWQEIPPGPWRVTLTRYGARRLDGDNFQTSLKVVRDCVAEWLGVDDGDVARVKWRYRQRAGWSACVGIEIQEV